MDEQIKDNTEWMTTCLKNWNTHELWRAIARCIERGIANATTDDERELKAMGGHGKTNVKVCKVPFDIQHGELATAPDDAAKSLQEHSTAEGKEAQRCQRQQNRINQIIHRLRRRAAKFPMHNNSNHHRPRTTCSAQQLARTHDEMNDSTVKAIASMDIVFGFDFAIRRKAAELMNDDVPRNLPRQTTVC